jgi:hypothetical protein
MKSAGSWGSDMSLILDANRFEEDAALFKDVRNRALLSAPRGRVYRTKGHVALLCHHARCQRPSRRTR